MWKVDVNGRVVCNIDKIQMLIDIYKMGYKNKKVVKKYLN